MNGKRKEKIKQHFYRTYLDHNKNSCVQPITCFSFLFKDNSNWTKLISSMYEIINFNNYFVFSVFTLKSICFWLKGESAKTSPHKSLLYSHTEMEKTRKLKLWQLVPPMIKTYCKSFSFRSYCLGVKALCTTCCFSACGFSLQSSFFWAVILTICC